MYTIVVLGEVVFRHDSKDVWKAKAELLQSSSWGHKVRFGYEPN